jgi:hypothetical protein
MAVYLGEATTLSLEQPREIFTSAPKMCLSLLTYIVAAALIGGVSYAKHGLAWPLIAAAILLLASFGVFKHWKYRTQPILVLSKEGIRLARKDGDKLVPWANVTENTWHENRYGFMKTSAIITLRDSAREKSYMVNAKWLTIQSDDYLRLCDLYATAARHGDRHG